MTTQAHNEKLWAHKSNIAQFLSIVNTFTFNVSSKQFCNIELQFLYGIIL